MKTISNGYKEALNKLGREIDFKIGIYTNDKLIAENGDFLMTENNLHLVVDQFNEEELDHTINSEDIYNVSIINKGNILSTMMKEADFEISQDLRIGDIVYLQFGLKVEENYEYINYGKYIIYSKEYNEDTKTYSYVSFDSMLLSMIKADSEYLTTLENKTIKNVIISVCNKVGLTYTPTEQELIDYPNLNKTINNGTFANMTMTCRDVLDAICQALGLSMIVEDKTLKLKSINRQIVNTFNEEYLKDINVSFGKKYGPINSVVLSRSDNNDTIYRKDEESINEYGLHEFKIKDNLLLLYNDRGDYIDEIFNQLNGIEFYLNDFTSTGITCLDWLDFYNVQIGDNIYKCLMLDDEILINQGLEENVYTEEPEETITDYTTSSMTDKEVSFIVDKQIGQINAKVSKGNVINEINIDESGVQINANRIDVDGVLSVLGESGSTIINGDNITTGTINANRINGGTISGSSINLGNGTFSVNTSGYMNATSGKIGNLTIDNGGIYVVGNESSRDAGIGVDGTRYAFWAGASQDATSSAPFRVGHDGSMVASSGTVGGWNLSSSQFSSGDSYINKNGNIVFKNDNGLLAAGGAVNFLKGNGSQHPVVISDMLGQNDTSWSTATVGIVARYGNIALTAKPSGSTGTTGIIMNTGTGGVSLNNSTIHAGSSRKMKKHIKKLKKKQKEEIYNAVKEMPLYKYDYKKKFYNGDKNQYGFIIEDIENTIIKDVIHINKDDNGYKQFNATDLPKLNLIIIKELMEKIENLENEISKLKESDK